jgi:hypothetical protein
MDPLWLFLIVPAAVIVGVFGAYYANTYKGMGDDDAREIAAKALDKSYPQVARKVRAGMRSSNWTEDLVDPGLLIDVLESVGR